MKSQNHNSNVIMKHSSAQKETQQSTFSKGHNPLQYFKADSIKRHKEYENVMLIQENVGPVGQNFDFTFNPKLSTYRRSQLREVLKDKTQQILNKAQQQTETKYKPETQQKHPYSGSMRKGDLISIAKQVINQQPQSSKKMRKLAQDSQSQGFKMYRHSSESKENLSVNYSQVQSTQGTFENIQSLKVPDYLRGQFQSGMSSPQQSHKRRGIKSSPKLPEAFRERVNPYYYNNSHIVHDENSFENMIDNSQTNDRGKIIGKYRTNLVTPVRMVQQAATADDGNIKHRSAMQEVKLFQTPSEDHFNFPPTYEIIQKQEGNRNKNSLAKWQNKYSVSQVKQPSGFDDIFTDISNNIPGDESLSKYLLNIRDSKIDDEYMVSLSNEYTLI